jgi:RNA binding exosome subunit
MADDRTRLETMLIIGQMAKNMFEARQAEFDRSNPHMTEDESKAADLLQHIIQEDFSRKIEKNKEEGADFNGMDLLELRIWAPDAKCALVQIHDHLTKEYGLFPHIALSSGIQMIAKDKLFFISVLVRKMAMDELIGKPK